MRYLQGQYSFLDALKLRHYSTGNVLLSDDNITITQFWRATCFIFGPTKRPDKSLLARGPKAQGPTMTWKAFLKGQK